MESENTSKNHAHWPFVVCAILGFSGVLLGALGAHALRPALLESGNLESWTTAVQYHLIHAVALFALLLATRGRFGLTAISWGVGILIFSGSIYILSLGGPKFLGPVTPLGGLALLLGWASLALPKIRRKLTP